MPTYKIKKLIVDDLESFKALGDYIFVSGNELIVHDNNLYYELEQAEKNSKTIAILKEENIRLKEKQRDISILISERDDLKEQLDKVLKESKSSSEYQGQIDKYKLEISQLKKQEDKQLSQIQDITKQKQSLQKDNQALQNEKKELQESNKQLNDSIQKKEDIRDVFNKWGTYQSLQKDIAIVKFFMETPNQEIRQKTIIKRFNNYMDKTTVRLHLYKLVNKGILEEPQFKGSYQLNTDNDFQDIAIDVDRIASLILGKNLYEMAVDQHKQKKNRPEY